MAESSIERPTGVQILSVLVILGGIFFFLIGFALIAAGGFAAVEGFEAIGGVLGAIGFIVFILGVITIGSGWGLWNLKKWAYQVTMIVTFLFFIFSILTIPAGILGLIIFGIILYYLTRSEIKEIYGITGFLS